MNLNQVQDMAGFKKSEFYSIDKEEIKGNQECGNQKCHHSIFIKKWQSETPGQNKLHYNYTKEAKMWYELGSFVKYKNELLEFGARIITV